MSTRDLKASVRARPSVKVKKDRRKHNLAPQHLQAAKLFAKKAQAIEDNNKRLDETQRPEYLAYVTGAVVSAVAFLEASINATYLYAVDRDRTNLPTFDERLFRLFGQFWKDVERYRILQKYQIALLLAGKAVFDADKNPYQDAILVIELRNDLVHYKSKWDYKADDRQNPATRFRGKFTLSPYAPPRSLWLPHRYLGAGCAKWSIKAVQEFSDEFCDRLGIPMHSV